MFTGIISDVGEVVRAEREGDLMRLEVACAYPADSIEVGASICHAGVCLTAIEAKTAGNRTLLSTDVGAETLAITTLGGLREGTRINMERSLKLGDELGGHMVSGHVDGMAEILDRRDFDGMAHFRFRAPHGWPSSSRSRVRSRWMGRRSPSTRSTATTSRCC